MKVKLIRSFWGHAVGTKATVRSGWLYIKGSPKAKVLDGDLGNLFVEDK